jgi:hypothetical protein
VVVGAAHIAWTDLGMSVRDAFGGYAIAFLDRYVMGDTSAAPALKRPGTAAIAHDDAAD